MKNVIQFCFSTLIVLLSSVSYALSPQQYCEKLHQKVLDAGGRTSVEMLNVDYPGTTTVNFNQSGPTQFVCNDGAIVDRAEACSGHHGGFNSMIQSQVANVYTLSISTKKCCLNGDFVFSKVTQIEYIQGCGSGGCPPRTPSCEGSACNAGISTCPN